jgi:hypothetical protein
VINIQKYIAIALFLSGISVCSASRIADYDVEAQQPSVVVYQQDTVSQTAEAFLKHGAGDIAFLAVTGARQLSDSEVFVGMYCLVQLFRYYQLGMTINHATLDAVNYKSWPYVFFATSMAIHAVGDIAFDLPSLANSIRSSVTLDTILRMIPIIDELTGAKEGIIGYAAGMADAIKELAVPISAITFTLAIYRFRHDGTLEAAWNKLKPMLLTEQSDQMAISGIPPRKKRR